MKLFSASGCIFVEILIIFNTHRLFLDLSPPASGGSPPIQRCDACLQLRCCVGGGLSGAGGDELKGDTGNYTQGPVI